MKCSQNVEHSRMFYVTIEKEILRDISAGIFKELEFLSEYIGKREYYEHLNVIQRYANNLRRVCE